ncbi:MAG: hypothetical protein JRJ24_07665 [Deltaproteobacteria bacterium]|nr:hypothetical protein [Deltaproteobacteria bacterium]
MINATKLGQLAELFQQTGEAHHQAFLETDGDDPEWTLWHAEHLQDRLAPFLGAPLTRSRLVFCLIGADDEHRATESDVRSTTSMAVLFADSAYKRPLLASTSLRIRRSAQFRS